SASRSRKLGGRDDRQTAVRPEQAGPIRPAAPGRQPRPEGGRAGAQERSRALPHGRAFAREEARPAEALGRVPYRSSPIPIFARPIHRTPRRTSARVLFVPAPIFESGWLPRAKIDRVLSCERNCSGDEPCQASP